MMNDPLIAVVILATQRFISQSISMMITLSKNGSTSVDFKYSQTALKRGKFINNQTQKFDWTVISLVKGCFNNRMNAHYSDTYNLHCTSLII